MEPAWNHIKVVERNLRSVAVMERHIDDEKEDDSFLKILMLVLCMRVSATVL